MGDAATTRELGVSYALAVMERDAEDPALRLILENRNLVYMMVRRLHPAAPNYEQEEAISDGFVGLVDGARKFDHGRDILPTTFLVPRIRGAILDGRRNRDRLSRLTRRRKTQVSKATAKIAARVFRTPTSREVAAELGVPVERLWKWQLDLVGDEWIDFDNTPDLGAGLAGTLASRFEDTKALRSINQFEAAISIKSSLFALNDQQRLVFGLYYGDGFKMADIGEHLGVTEARICQIVAKSKRVLFAAMTRNAA